MPLKTIKKTKARLFLYLGDIVDAKNLNWFLVNDTEIILTGESLSNQLIELAKQYKTYAIFPANSASLISVDAPLGVKKADYPMLLEDHSLTPLEDCFITLLDSAKVESGGLVLDFILLTRDKILPWCSLLENADIYIASYFLDTTYFKNALEGEQLPQGCKILTLCYDERGKLFVYKDAKNRLAWLYWHKSFGNMPVYIKELYDNKATDLVFTTPYETFNFIIKNNYTATSLNIPKPKRQGMFYKFNFLKNIRLSNFAFIKTPFFIFCSILLVLYITNEIMLKNLATKKIVAEYASIETLKLDKKMPTQEFIKRIESGAKNYPSAEKKIAKINDILTKIDAQLNSDISPMQISWNAKKLSVILRLANETSLENIQKLTEHSEVDGTDVKLEFDLE